MEIRTDIILFLLIKLAFTFKLHHVYIKLAYALFSAHYDTISIIYEFEFE